MIKIRVKKDLSGLEALEKQLPIKANEVLDSVSQAIADNIHSNWTEVSPSAPGERPAVVTGTLDLSVEVEKQGRDFGGRFASGENISMRVIKIGAPYAGILEHGSVNMMPRPFVLPAVLDEEDKLPDECRGLFNILW